MNDSIYVARMIVDQFEYFLNKRKIEIHNPLKDSKLTGSYPPITNLYDVDRSMLVVAVSSILEKYCSNIGEDTMPGNDRLATLEPVMYPKGGFGDHEWAESEVYVTLSEYVKELSSVMKDISPESDKEDTREDNLSDLAYRTKHNMSTNSTTFTKPDKDKNTYDGVLYRIKHNMSIDSSMLEDPDKGEIPTGSRQVNHL